MTMMIVILGDDLRAPIAWQRWDNDEIVETGNALDVGTLYTADTYIAVVPASSVVIDPVDISGLAPAQARTVAQSILSETSIGPVGDLHIAIAVQHGLAARVDRSQMTIWLDQLKPYGVDPDIIIPASLLVPYPEQGFYRAKIFDQPVLRAKNAAFADEDGVSEAILRDSPVSILSPEAVQAALPALLADPILNLRQGVFAGKTRLRLESGQRRRILLWAIACIIIALLTAIICTIKLNYAAYQIEKETLKSAEAVFRGTADPVAQLEQRLAQYRGAGGGFIPNTAAIFSVVQAVPSMELITYDVDGEGRIRMNVAASAPAELAMLRDRLEQAGFTVTLGNIRSEAGRHVADMGISRR